MSANWTIYCATCESYGPDIRRSGGTYHLSGKWPRFHPGYDREQKEENNDVQGQWSAFMEEHEWHGQLELKHE